MRKTTNWDRYYARQMKDATTRRLVEDDLRALRVGVQLARLRQEAGLTQTQLAAKVGMSAPNISRIESSPEQNLILQTLVKLSGAWIERSASFHESVGGGDRCLLPPEGIGCDRDRPRAIEAQTHDLRTLLAEHDCHRTLR